MYLAASGSCEIAKMALPKRVNWINIYSAAMATAATAKVSKR